MIDVHKIMIDHVAMIPEISGLKTHYDWGDEEHLNLLIKIYNEDTISNKNLYPLVYNVSNKTKQDPISNEAVSKLSLVIATRNKHTEYTNGQRWATSYKNVLFPTVQYLEQMFTRSSVMIWDRVSDLYEHPNYGNRKENETIDIWDALRMDLEVKFTDNCAREIKFSLL